MMANSYTLARRAMSPLIGIVIIATVAITVAVAAAFFISGNIAMYTKYEKVEIRSAWTVKDSINECWEIIFELKNTGPSASTAIRCFINNIPLNETGYNPNFDKTTDFNSSVRAAVSFDEDLGLTIESGEETTITVYISYATGSEFGSLSSGTNVNIRLTSAGGMDYIKDVILD